MTIGGIGAHESCRKPEPETLAKPGMSHQLHAQWADSANQLYFRGQRILLIAIGLHQQWKSVDRRSAKNSRSSENFAS